MLVWPSLWIRTQLLNHPGKLCHLTNPMAFLIVDKIFSHSVVNDIPPGRLKFFCRRILLQNTFFFSPQKCMPFSSSVLHSQVNCFIVSIPFVMKFHSFCKHFFRSRRDLKDSSFKGPYKLLFHSSLSSWLTPWESSCLSNPFPWLELLAANVKKKIGILTVYNLQS